MRVFLTGGSGVLGRALIPAFVAAGHSVDALAVTDEAAATVAALGGRPVAGDLLDRRGLDPITADVVAHFATSIPRPGAGTGSWVLNDQIRTVGTANLLRAAAAGGVGRVVAYSVIWVYGDHGDDWITEETPLPGRTRPEILSAVALEEAVRDSGLEWVIVRGGHLYGPGTGTTEELLAAAARGTLMTDGAGDAFDSLVTAADTAQVAVLAVERVPAGTILNAVDDRPMRQRELYEALAAYVGGPEPGRGPVVPGWGSLRVSNARARSYGFRPRHADVTSGLRALYGVEPDDARVPDAPPPPAGAGGGGRRRCRAAWPA